MDFKCLKMVSLATTRALTSVVFKHPSRLFNLDFTDDTVLALESHSVFRFSGIIASLSILS